MHGPHDPVQAGGSYYESQDTLVTANSLEHLKADPKGNKSLEGSETGSESYSDYEQLTRADTKAQVFGPQRPVIVEESDDEEIGIHQEELRRFMARYYSFQNYFGPSNADSNSDDIYPLPYHFAPRKLEPWKEPETLEEKRALYKCGDNFVEALSLPLFEEAFIKDKLKKPAETTVQFPPHAEINELITLWRGDSTCIEVDAVVNAANSSLLGGGGIDGQIHEMAGRHLLEECRKLNGCSTGFTKMTNAYRLPAKKILHTVGPTRENPEALTSCYRTCLELAKENGLKTVAFCCISTGIYGYPLRKATSIALRTVREYLEEDDNYKSFDRIIFVVYKLDAREEKVYQRYIPRYFPLVNYPEDTEEQSDTEEETPRYSSYSHSQWMKFYADSDDSSDYETDESGEETYFQKYFQSRGGSMPWEDDNSDS